MTIDKQKNTRRTTGVVVSNSMDKSATIAVQRRLKHPLYNKYIYKTTKIMIHDEENASKVGDKVTIGNLSLSQRIRHGFWIRF